MRYHIPTYDEHSYTIADVLLFLPQDKCDHNGVITLNNPVDATSLGFLSVLDNYRDCVRKFYSVTFVD